MEENELKDAFWTPLFIIAGFSFLFFGSVMFLFGGAHAGLYLKVGALGLIVGLVSHMTDRYYNSAAQAHGFQTPEAPGE